MILLRAVLVALLVSKGSSVICGDKTCDSTGCLVEIDKNGRNCDVQCMNITSTNNCTEEENEKLQCFCNGEDCHRKENTISEWKSMVVNFTKPNEFGKCMDKKRAELYWKCGDVNCSGTSESCHFEIEDQNESDPKCKIQCLPDNNNITSETSCANGTDNNLNCYCKGSHCDKQRETINKWRDAVNSLTTDKDKIEKNMDHCLHKKGIIVTHCGSDNCTKSNDNSCKIEVNKGGDVCGVQCSEKDSSIDECLESDDKQKMECFCKTDDCHTARTTIDNWRNGTTPEFSEGLGTCLSGKGLIVTQCGEDKCPPGRDRSCRIKITATGSNCTVGCSSEDSLVNECRDHPSNVAVRECFCKTNDCHLHGTTIESWRTSIITVSSGFSFKSGLETCLLEKGAVVKSCGGTACQGSEDKSCRIETNDGGDICTLGCSAETGSKFGCISPSDQNTTANSTIQCFCKENNCDKNGDIIEKWRANVKSSFSGGLETCLLNQNSIVTSCGGDSCSVKGVDKSCRIEVNKETEESKVECSSKGIVKEECGLIAGSNDTMACFCHSNDCDRKGTTIEAWRTFFSPDERKNFSNIFENYLYEQGSIVRSCGGTTCDGPKDKSCGLVNNVKASKTCDLECSAEDGSERKCTPTSEEGFACLCEGKDCYMRAETVDKWRTQTRNGTVEFRDQFENCLHSSNAIVRKCGSQNCTAVGQDKSCKIKVDNGNTCEIGCSNKDPLVDECKVSGNNAMECFCKKDDCHMIGATIETWRINPPLPLETQFTQCLHNQGAIVRQCGAESCVNGTDKSCRIELDTNGVNCNLGCSKEDSLVDKCRKVEGNSTLFECFCKTDNCHLHGTTIDEWRKSQEGIDGTFNIGVTRCLRQKGSLVEFCGVGTITECTSQADKSCMMESSTKVDACNVKCSKETGPKEGGCTITGNQTTTSNSTIRCFCRTNNCDRDGAIIEQWRSSVENITSSIGITISPVESTTGSVDSTTSPVSVITNSTNITTITLAEGFETCLYTKHAIVKSCGGVKCTGMNDKSCKIEVNGSEAKCDVTCSSEGIVEEKCRTAAGNNNTVECFCNTNDCDQKGTTIDNWRSLMKTDELKNLTESFNSCLYQRDVIVKSCGGNKCTSPADKSCRVKSDENGGQCNIECSDKESLKPYCKTDSPNDSLHCFCGGKDCYENFETINQWRNQTRQEDSLKKFEGGFNECLYSEGVIVQKCGHNQCTNSEFIKSCKMTVDRGGKCAIECVNEDPLADECRPGDNSTLECFCKKDDCHTHTPTIESWRNMSKSLGEELDSCLYKKEAIVKQCGAETCVNGTDMSCRIEVNRDGAICNLGCSKEHSSVNECRKVEGNNAEVHECFCKTDDCHLIGTTIDAWRASSEKLNRYFENGVTKCLREKDSLVQFCGVDTSVGCPASADKSCMMRSNGNGTTCEVVCSEETGPKEGGCATTVNQTTTENSTIQCFCRTNNCDRDGAVIEQWRNSVKNITSSLKTAANSTLAEGFETCLLSEHAIVKSCAGKTCSPKNDKSCKIEVNGMESKCEVTCSSEGIVEEMCRTAARNNNTIECFCNTNDCDQKGTTTDKWRTLIDKEEGLKNFTEPFKSCLYKRDVIVEKCGTNTCTMVDDKSCRIEADKNGNSCELTCSAHDGSNKRCTAHPHTGNIQCLCNGKDCYKRSETVNQWINQTKDKDALKKLNGGLITCLNTQGAIVRKCGNHNCTESGKIKSCQLTIDQEKNCKVECSDEDPLVDECRHVTGNNNKMKCFCKKDDCHTHGTTIESWRNSSHLLKAELQTCLHNQGAVVTRCGGVECSNGTDKSCRIGFNSDGNTCDVGCSDEDSFVDDCRKDEKNNNLVECYCKTDDCHLNVELIEKWRASTILSAHATHRDGFEKCLHKKGSIVTRCGSNDCQDEDDKSCELQTNVSGDLCEIKCSPKPVPTETCTTQTHGNDTSNSTIHCFCKQDNCEIHGSIIETWRGKTKHSEYSAGLETCLYNKSVIVKTCGGHKCTNGEDKSCRIEVNEEKEECNVGCSSEGILTDMCRVSPLNNKTIECFCKKDDCDHVPETIEKWRTEIQTDRKQLKNFSVKFEDCLNLKGAIVKYCGENKCVLSGHDKSCKFQKDSCEVKCSPDRGSEFGCTWKSEGNFECFCKKDNCDMNATVIDKWREDARKQNKSTELRNCLVKKQMIVESCSGNPCTAPKDKSCKMETDMKGDHCPMACSSRVASYRECDMSDASTIKCFCKGTDCDTERHMITHWEYLVETNRNSTFIEGFRNCLYKKDAIVRICGDIACSNRIYKSCKLHFWAKDALPEMKCSVEAHTTAVCIDHNCFCNKDNCHKNESTIAKWRTSVPGIYRFALDQYLHLRNATVIKCGDETCTAGNDTSCKVEFNANGSPCSVGCASEYGSDGNCTSDGSGTLKCYCKFDNCERNGNIIDGWREEVRKHVVKDASSALEVCLRNKGLVVSSCGGHKCEFGKDKSCKIETKTDGQSCIVQCSAEFKPLFPSTQAVCSREGATDGNSTVKCFCRGKKDCDSDITVIGEWREEVEEMDKPKLKEDFEQCLYDRDALVHSCGVNKCSRGADKSCRMSVDEKRSECKLECSDVDVLNKCRLTTDNKTIECFCQKDKCHLNANTIEGWRSSVYTGNNQLQNFTAHLEHCLHEKKAIVRLCGTHPCEKPKDKSCQFNVNPWTESEPSFCSAETAMTNDKNECNKVSYSSLQCFCRTDNCDKKGTTIEAWKKSANDTLGPEFSEKFDEKLREQGAMVKKCGTQTCDTEQRSCSIEIKSGAKCETKCSNEDVFKPDCTNLNENSMQCFCERDDCHRIGHVIDDWRNVANRTATLNTFTTDLEDCLRDQGATVTKCGSDVCKPNEDKSCRVSTGRHMGCSSEDGLDGMCKEVDGNIECFCKHNDCHLNGTTIEKWRDYVRRNSSLNHSTLKFENSLHAKNLTVTNCGDNHCWGGKDKSCQMTIHKNGTDCQLECSFEGSLQDDCVLSSDNRTTHCYCREDDCHQKKSTIENWIDRLNLTRNQTIEKLDTCLHVKGSLVKSCGGVRCEDGKRFLSCKIEVGTDGSNCVVGCSEEDGPANECTTKNNTIQCLCRKNNCDKDKRMVGQWKSSFGENGLTPFLHGCLHRLHPTTIRPLRTVGPKVVKQSNFTGQTLKDLQGRLAAAKRNAQPLVQQKEDGGFTFKWWYIFLIVALLVTIGLFGVVIWSAATRKKRCEKYWKAREEEEKKKKAAAAAAAQKMRQMSKEAEMEVLSEKDIIKKGPHHLQSKFKGDMKHLRDNQKSESIHDKVEFVPQLNEEVEIGSDVEVIDGMEQQSYAETMSVSRIDNFNTVRQVSSTASIQN